MLNNKYTRSVQESTGIGFFYARYVELFGESCIKGEFTGFSGPLVPWDICSAVFGSDNIKLDLCTYRGVGMGGYSKQIGAPSSDGSVCESDDISSTFKKEQRVFNTKKARLDYEGEVFERKEFQPDEVWISLKDRNILICFYSDCIEIGWSTSDPTCEILVNGLFDYLLRNSQKPPARTILKRTPEIRVVMRTSMGEFYSPLIRLPYNRITPNMLADSYQVSLADKIVNGKEFMETLVNKLTKTIEVEGETIFPEKGLFIINGEPGTGKSKFLTELLLELNKQERPVFYFSPESIGLLGMPEFVPWLIQNQGAIIVAEDAEVVLKAGESRTAATSNILNLADGVLGDALQLTIIATFNCNIQEIDRALLRPGRLQLAAEFLPLANTALYNAAETILQEKRNWAVEATGSRELMVRSGIADAMNKAGNSKDMTLAALYQVLFELQGEKSNV